MQKTVYHPADSRGTFDYGWLKTAHSFSFSNWHIQGRDRFGLLRVLNDDLIAPENGFGMHPHENMEIITIPLSGAITHHDSAKNQAILRAGEVQVMSAGSGIKHSEYNLSPTEPCHMLQLWIFPSEFNILASYKQKSFDPQGQINQWQLIVSPDETGGSLPIHQDARLSLAMLSAGKAITYSPKSAEHGVYLFVISGTGMGDDQPLEPRDGYGRAGVESVAITAETDMHLLAIEVPM